MSEANGTDRAIKAAASRIGVSVGTYLFNLKIGQKYCWKCESFHPRNNFGRDKSRSDGLLPFCRNSYIKRHQDRCTSCQHVREQRMVKVCWHCIDELRTYRKEKQLNEQAEKNSRKFLTKTGRGRKARHENSSPLTISEKRP